MLTALLHQINMFILVYNSHEKGWRIYLSWEAKPGGGKLMEYVTTICRSGPDTDWFIKERGSSGPTLRVKISVD